MNADQMKALAKPFEENEIGKLPRVTCRACSESKGAKHCGEHRARVCDVCHAFVSERHMHIDYVGHADVTRRLLEVDPGWTWEPLALSEAGIPVFDKSGGLWIKLTIADVTRYGYGDQNNGQGAKEAIGDAIRNAAMRFGVALDLWSKADAFEFTPLETTTAPVEPAAPPGAPAPQETSGTGSAAREGSDTPAGPARLQPGEEPVSDTTPPDASPEASPVEQAGGEAGATADDPPAAAGDYEAPATEEQWNIAREHIGTVPTILGKYQKKFGSRKKQAEVTQLELAELIEDALKKVPA